MQILYLCIFSGKFFLPIEEVSIEFAVLRDTPRGRSWEFEGPAPTKSKWENTNFGDIILWPRWTEIPGDKNQTFSGGVKTSRLQDLPRKPVEFELHTRLTRLKG